MESFSETRIDVNEEKPWYSIKTIYDASGQILQRTKLFDDNKSRIETYQDGVLRKVVITDPEPAPNFTPVGTPPRPTGGDNYPWKSKAFYYDEAGDLIGKIVRTDEDLVKTKVYEDGSLTEKHLYDDSRSDNAPGDVPSFGSPPPQGSLFPWSAKKVTYDNEGNVVERLTEYDDGDVDVIVFSEGVRTEKRKIDYADDDPWLIRQTYYDADGDTVYFAEYPDGSTPPAELLVEYEAPPPFESAPDFPPSAGPSPGTENQLDSPDDAPDFML